MAKHLVIVGAQRSGTTYLYKILDEHPQVYMAKPVKPEPKYFMNLGDESLSYDSYYSRYFSNAGDVLWLGEKSTSYIESEESMLSIKRILPEALILVMLRDPVERAISHYSFSKDHGLEPYDIERAIQEESSRGHKYHNVGTSVTPYSYIERGKYIQYLDQWSKLFEKEKLILLIAEHFIGNQVAVSALYKQLDINSQFIPPSIMIRVNSGSETRSKCELSDRLRTSLRNKFKPWNYQLEMRYGLDLSVWGKK